MNEDPGWEGRDLELDVGPIAHGGFCIARHEGRVVFVRHTLPGERVRAVVTEDRTGSYCRADAIEILVASPDRVVARCPISGPGGCGGCDFQHVDPDAQRRLKADVVQEALARIAGIERAVTVEALPGGPTGWRTRLRLKVNRVGQAGFSSHRSHGMVPVEDCLIVAPGALEGVAEQRFRRGSEVDIAVDRDGRPHVWEVPAFEPRRRGRPVARPRPAPRIVREAAGREFTVSSTSFWQPHHAAADVLAAIVGAWADAPPEGVAWDLYAGVGVFASVLAGQVGPGGTVLAVESSRSAVRDGAGATTDLPQLRFVHGAVGKVFGGLRPAPDVVVLDPPRKGAGKQIAAAIAAQEPRRIVHVACDPASLARDLAAYRTGGYGLAALRALDTFPMTHHVECVALLEPEV